MKILPEENDIFDVAEKETGRKYIQGAPFKCDTVSSTRHQRKGGYRVVNAMDSNGNARIFNSGLIAFDVKEN